MIESALSWLGDLARFVGSMVPRILVVQSSHRAVKYVRGATPVLLEPGVHWYWPLVTPIEFTAVVRALAQIPTQLLETADDETVAASGVIEYEIRNPIAFLAHTEDGWSSVAFMGAIAVRRVVMSRERGELCDKPAEVDVAIRELAQRLLRPYGVKVLRVQLKDFARVRAIHLTGRGDAPGHVDPAAPPNAG